MNYIYIVLFDSIFFLLFLFHYTFFIFVNKWWIERAKNLCLPSSVLGRFAIHETRAVTCTFLFPAVHDILLLDNIR